MCNITPKIDIAFKKIFGIEENKDLLISLINSIVSPEDQVQDLTLRNPYNYQNYIDDKLSILDIKAQSLSGEIFNIEMQLKDDEYYEKRALYYWSKLYIDQLTQGKNYKTLNKSIGIHILNFTCLHDTKEYHNIFHLKEKRTNLHYFKDIEIHIIELNKFTKQAGSTLTDLLKKIKTSLDIWLAFLTRHNILDQSPLPDPLDTPYMQKALHTLSCLNFNNVERDIYEGRLKWLRHESLILEQTFEKGIEKGRQEGIEKGEKQKAQTIAKKLLKSHALTSEQISQITGLNKAEIDVLKNSSSNL